MKKILNAIFFGSTEDSVRVVEQVSMMESSHIDLRIVAVMTHAPRPVGRKQLLTPSPVAVWAEAKKLPILCPATIAEKPWQFVSDADASNSVSTFSPDLLISASFGVKLPSEMVTHTRYGALNIHPSLLPRWRGTDPTPWTILAGDAQTGVTISKITDSFDAGDIVGQKKVAVEEKESPDELRARLFDMGAALLTELLPAYIEGSIDPVAQTIEHATYARRLSREDGYIPWTALTSVCTGAHSAFQFPSATYIPCSSYPNEATMICRHIHALSPWPGVWTEISLTSEKTDTKEIGHQSSVIGLPTKKRLKILSAHVQDEKLIIDTVQLEGKNPVLFTQFEQAYLTSGDGKNIT
jgi:methionyl-tRNA formyltransferase